MKPGLPPLGNLFALRDENPARLNEVAASLEAGGEFDEIWRPHPRWVAAVSLLPETEPDPPAARAAGLVFAEGRDILCSNGVDPDQRYPSIAERARAKPETLDQLPGDFAFLCFDGDGGATAVRACGGRVPFYLWEGNAPSPWPSPASERGGNVRPWQRGCII